MSGKILIWLLATVLLTTVPLAEAEQAKKVPRIGFLVFTSAGAQESRLQAFRQGLRDLGYIEGQNIVIEARSGEGKPDRVHASPAHLVGLQVDIIVTGGPQASRPPQKSNCYHSHCHGV